MLRVAAVIAALLLTAGPAAAHGFGQRFDLPLPLWLWVTGAGATIVVSFVVVALFVRERPGGDLYPRFVLFRRAGRGAWLVWLLRVVVAALFLLTVATGLFGEEDPYHNLTPIMVWVIWWVGVALVCILLGDLWALVNPLDTLFRGFEALTHAHPHYDYPRWLGTWPSVLLFFLFAWAELVWDAKDEPLLLAYATIAYAAFAWIGMILFGREAWLRRGEAFSVAFGVFARFAVLDVRDEDVALRPPGVGLLNERAVSVSFTVFVLLMLSTVTFDGFLETPFWNRLFSGAYNLPVMARILFDLSSEGIDDAQVMKSIGLVAFPLLFVVVYWCGSWAMVRAADLFRRSGPPRAAVSVTDAATGFVLTLVPIAVAYHLAHYLSLLLTAGQLIVPIASDPFGVGWDLFGTAGYRIDLGLVGPKFFWYTATTVIVIGHAAAVYLSHVVALRVFGDRRAALVSQGPMLALMVAYTMLSLWILAQPIVG